MTYAERLAGFDAGRYRAGMAASGVSGERLTRAVMHYTAARLCIRELRLAVRFGLHGRAREPRSRMLVSNLVSALHFCWSRYGDAGFDQRWAGVAADAACRGLGWDIVENVVRICRQELFAPVEAAA